MMNIVPFIPWSHVYLLSTTLMFFSQLYEFQCFPSLKLMLIFTSPSYSCSGHHSTRVGSDWNSHSTISSKFLHWIHFSPWELNPTRPNPKKIQDFSTVALQIVSATMIQIQQCKARIWQDPKKLIIRPHKATEKASLKLEPLAHKFNDQKIPTERKKRN